jgi:ATP-dependent helicase/nuclease subunit A
MNLTLAQERAVATTGMDLAVRAGAGSGKTRVLIERAVRLLCRDEDPLKLSEILAITFTEKASLEMKLRLADELEKHRGPAARAQVQWAWVGTIHGFCSRLLRENAVEAAVDPSFEVLDQDRARVLLTEVFEEISLAFSATREEELGLLLRVDLPDPTEELLALYGRVRGTGARVEEIEIPEPDQAAVREALGRVIEVLRKVIPLREGATPAARKIADAALERLPIFDRAIETVPDFPELAVLAAEFRKDVPLRMRGEMKELLKEVKEELLPEVVAAAADQWVLPALSVMRGFLAEFDRRYRRRKDDLGVLDFTDLESRALDLLTESPEVRSRVAGRFRQILVDEYQDVNPLQERIIRLLRSPGNHFAVGDVKQSIYAFRHAEPSLFQACAKEVGEEGTIDLAVNFRSSPGLVEFTNHCFEPLLAGQSLVDWCPMEAGADYPAEAAPEVEILLSEGEDVGEYRDREARALAARIRAIVEHGEIILRRPGERQGSPASYRDIAILFRSLGDLKRFERALEEQDVPTYVVKGGGYYQAREVVDLLNLLRIVQNPRDEVALAATLRSPFGGLSDDSLLALAIHRPEGGSLADLLGDADLPRHLPEQDQPRWARFGELLLRLRRLAGQVSLRKLVKTALDESGYAAAVWLFYAGRRHVANFTKALSLAESFEGNTDLAGFVRALEDMKDREVRETEAPTGGEAEDVVRILTIHGAKGLEFPVVFLPDLCRLAPTHVPPIHYHENRVAVKALEPTGQKVPTSTHAGLEELRKRSEEEEALRILYVGITRAEEKLFLLARDGEKGEKGKHFWHSLREVLAVGEGSAPFGSSGREALVLRTGEEEAPAEVRVALVRRAAAKLLGGEPLDLAGERERTWAEDLYRRTAAPRPVFDGTCYQNTISELLLHANCRRCYRDRYLLGIPRGFELADLEECSDPAGADELPATDRGVAVHEVLRVFDPHGRDSLAAVAGRRLDALRPGGFPAEFVAEVVALVEGFYESEVGRQVLAADPRLVRREMPFFVRYEIEGGEAGDLLLRGQIDLLYPTPEGSLSIIDYKTGHSPVKNYEVQIRAYARALKLFGEQKVTHAGLVYLNPGEAVRWEPIEISEEGDRELDRAAAAFAVDLKRGIPGDVGHSPSCSMGAQ